MTKSSAGPAASVPMLLAVLFVGGTVAGAGWWQMRLRALDDQISDKRSALKNLYLAGHLPPSEQVKHYLQGRTAALEQQYKQAVDTIAPEKVSAEAQADPQLYFQQRVHEVQTTLTRLSTAQTLTPPLLLGVPKDLPPADVAPRFLQQLSLIEDAAEVVLAVRGVTQLTSLKIEDPEDVPPAEDAKVGFLTRLPVRIRLVGSLEAVTKVIAMIDHASPVMDLKHARVALVPTTKPEADSSMKSSGTDAAKSAAGKFAGNAAKPAGAAKPPDAPEPAEPTGPPQLEAEFVVCRYLVTTPRLEQPEEPSDRKPAGRAKKSNK